MPLDACCQLWVVSCEIRKISICIFYFFEHSRTKHTLILVDSRSSYQPYQDNASVVYTPDAGENASQDGIEEFQVTRNMHSGKVILKDYNFQSPNKNLTYQAQASANQNYEIYHYPGRYKDRYGNTLARIRLQEMIAFKEMAVGSGFYHRFTPGKWFRLARHEQRTFNRQFLLTAITHSGYQPSTTRRVATESRQPGYVNDFVAIPTSVTFAPARKIPQPRMKGLQTAVVTGPAGEEIYPHAEKDLTIMVENEKEETIGTSELMNVGLNRTAIVGSDLNETIAGNQRISVGINQSETIGVAKQVSVGGALTESIGTSRRVVIGHRLSESIGSKMQVSVGNDMAETIGGRVMVSVGKDWSRSIGGNLIEKKRRY
jgi:uncharacterized protein involved in type VI secretion and phage assembly